MTQTSPPQKRIEADALERDLVTSIDELESMFGQPKETSVKKVTPRLTDLMRGFIAQSPIYLLATANEDGTCDVSPRGDPAGAIRVVDAQTLILPDRSGNNRVDSLRNIVNNPRAGLLVLVPGSDDTLRINGRAKLSRNPTLLDAMPMQGKTPKLAIIVDIDEAYMHCARAFRRSHLWQPESWPDRDDVPSMASILHDQFRPQESIEEFAREREERYLTTLY